MGIEAADCEQIDLSSLVLKASFADFEPLINLLSTDRFQSLDEA
jgi:hypothetical protein